MARLDKTIRTKFWTSSSGRFFGKAIYTKRGKLIKVELSEESKFALTVLNNRALGN